MIGGNFPNISMQVFYVSKEETNSPLLVDIIKTGKKLKEHGILTKGVNATMSLGFGKRILINTSVKDYSNIKKDEIIEIVDYDPVKNTILVIGPTEPKSETSVHWMIHHARNDVNVVVQINDGRLAGFFKEKTFVVETSTPFVDLDLIKKVLRGLRNNSEVVINNKDVLFTGKSIEDIENKIIKNYEELK